MLSPSQQEPSLDLPAEPEPAWLDEDHALEPLDPLSAAEAGMKDPVVVDAAGRMWRLRHRPAWLEAVRRLLRLA
jgi:hypothetical protein